MRLSELLVEGLFEKSFSEMLKFAPEIKNQHSLFSDMFDYLRALPSIVRYRTIVIVDSHPYLGDDINYLRLSTYLKDFHNLKEIPLLSQMVDPIYAYKYFKEEEPSIPKERVLALLLWNLVGLNQFEKSQTGHALKYNEKIVDRIYEVTPYNISPERGAYRIECTLDDYMWHEEKRTIVYLNYSDGYESEIEKITTFINKMMRKPTVILGKNPIRGIAMKCLFIA